MPIRTSPPPGEIPAEYAGFHPGAVFAAVAGGLSVLSFVHTGFAVLSPPALATGIWAARDIARYVRRGRGLARAGVICAFALPLLAGALEATLFHLESPAGFERVDFASLVRSRSAEEPPPLDRLVDRPICLKGNAIAQRSISPSSFSISPDDDSRTMSNNVIVELAHEEYEWSPEPIAVSGTLRALPYTADGPRYRLVDATVRPARTEYQKASRSNRGC